MLELYGRPLNLRKLVMLIILLAAIAAAGGIFLPSSIVRLFVLGVAALPVIAYLFDKPELIFYIFTFVTFSNIDIYAPIPIFRFLIIFLLASIVVAIVLGRKVVFHSAYFALLVVAFLILVFQSLAVARHLDISFDRLQQFVKLLLYLVLTVQFVSNRRGLRVFLLVVAAAIVVSNILPTFVPPPERYAGPSLLGTQGVFRFEGLFFEPNMIAFLQVFFIPFYIFLVMMYRKSFIGVVLLAGALILSLVAMVISFSRGSFVSLAFLLLLLMYVERRNRVVITIGLALIVLGIMLVPATYFARIGSLYEAVSGSSRDLPIYSRLETSKIALKMGIQHPLSGVGLDNFLPRAAFYTALPYAVHNAFLQVFSEVGVFALGVLIAIICHNIRIIKDLMSRVSDGEASQLGRILMVQHFAVLLNSMFIPVAYVDILWYTLIFPTLAHYAYRPVISIEK
jgi:putative inorganic carbon (HCO3(-)) transporter